MCGILGVVGIKPLINSLQAHRGPDGSGLWSSSDGRVQLAHRRLAILDRSERGAQPMADGSGRYRITFNGELDQSPRIG